MSYALRLEGDKKVDLNELRTDEDSGLTKEEGQVLTGRYIDELVELQELMYAAGKHSLLVVLQGRDTSGKDGTIRNVFGPLNSQSCSVTSFKAPTEEELAHDFLWRVHAHVPRTGQIQVFNRSHYEDVLVVRVHRLVDEEVWKPRYKQINSFEEILNDAGTVVLKFFLHISKDEQKKRLLDREKDPVKSWKLAVGDWKEREHWDEYTEAYQDVLEKCSTRRAPWYVVPADRKWYRNLAIAEAIRNELAPYRDGWMEILNERGREQRRILEAYRRERGKVE